MDADQYARNAIANCLKRTRPQHVEAIGRFFEKKRNAGLKDPSVKNYAVWLSWFSRAHDKPWQAITEAEIQAWLAGRLVIVRRGTTLFRRAADAGPAGVRASRRPCPGSRSDLQAVFRSG